MLETLDYILEVAAFGLERSGVWWWWAVALAALFLKAVLLTLPDK